MQQAIENWCNENKCSSFTFFKYYNLPLSKHFYLYTRFAKEAKKFELQVFNLINNDDKTKPVIERFQEYLYNLWYTNKDIFIFHIAISYDDSDIWIQYFDTTFDFVTKFLGMTNIPSDSIDDLINGKKITFNDVNIKLSKIDLW